MSASTTEFVVLTMMTKLGTKATNRGKIKPVVTGSDKKAQKGVVKTIDSKSFEKMRYV